MLEENFGSFQQFEIHRPTYLGKLPENFNDRYAIDCRADNGKSWFTIGTLIWDSRECGFDFEGVGMRYQQFATPELNQWLLKWTELKGFEKQIEKENTLNE